MKSAIKTISAAALVISMVNLNAMAEGNTKVLTLTTVLPVTISVTEVSAPEAVLVPAQRQYTAAQKAAIVELDFTSQKRITLKATNFLIESMPAIDGPAPLASQALAERIEYTPAQKAAMVELSF